MTKYIVSLQKTQTNAFIEQTEREELACEIIARLKIGNFHKSFLSAAIADSATNTWNLLRTSAIASVEIDDSNEYQWRNEISKLYEQEMKVQVAIENAYNDILNAAQEFDRTCKKSLTLRDHDIFEYFNLDKAFDQIDNTSHSEISDLVLNLFKVKFLTA